MALTTTTRIFVTPAIAAALFRGADIRVLPVRRDGGRVARALVATDPDAHGEPLDCAAGCEFVDDRIRQQD